jgi:hypothetical protein
MKYGELGRSGMNWGLAKRQMQAWQRGFIGFVSEQTQYNLLSRVPEMGFCRRHKTSGSG